MNYIQDALEKRFATCGTLCDLLKLARSECRDLNQLTLRGIKIIKIICGIKIIKVIHLEMEHRGHKNFPRIMKALWTLNR